MAKIKNITKGIKGVSGLSTSDILQMDVYKLNKKSLKQVTNRLISSANKRLRRLYNKAPSSPALRPHLEGVNKLLKQFSLKGKRTRNEIEEVMKDVKSFLNSPTSTIKGFEKFRKEVETRIGEFDSSEQESQFWNVYKDWVNKHPNESQRFNDSNMLVSMVYDEYIEKGLSERGAKSNITKAINKMLSETTEKITKEDIRMRSELENANSIRVKKDF